MKINLGSGNDYRAGPEWVNVDGYRDSDHHEGDTRLDVQADAHALPFADGNAYHVRASHVIEHCRYPLRVLEECHRVLCHRGTVYVEVPDANRTPAERDDHLYSWTPDTLRHIVMRAGFVPSAYERFEREWPGGWVGNVHSVEGVRV